MVLVQSRIVIKNREDTDMEEQGKKTITDIEVLDVTIRILSEISVPMALKRQIADPIEGAINNLFALREALAQSRQEEPPADAQELPGINVDDGEPEIVLEPGVVTEEDGNG